MFLNKISEGSQEWTLNLTNEPTVSSNNLFNETLWLNHVSNTETCFNCYLELTTQFQMAAHAVTAAWHSPFAIDSYIHHSLEICTYHKKNYNNLIAWCLSAADKTNWDIFEHPDLELFTNSKLCYIKICTIVTVEKRICVCPNQKT